MHALRFREAPVKTRKMERAREFGVNLAVRCMSRVLQSPNLPKSKPSNTTVVQPINKAPKACRALILALMPQDMHFNTLQESRLLVCRLWIGTTIQQFLPSSTEYQIALTMFSDLSFASLRGSVCLVACSKLIWQPDLQFVL